MKAERRWPAILTLYMLAGIIPESVATFNTPALLYVTNVGTFIFVPMFYGAAALLLRELLHRRWLGWPAILLLGAAFGALNEGVTAATWFRVAPKGFAFIGGVDWTWVVGLTFFHTAYSMLLPIALVECLFPRIASESWLGRRGFITFAVLLAFTQVLSVLQPTYQIGRLIVLAGAIIAIALALVLPSATPRVSTEAPAPGLWRLRGAGVLATLLFYSALYVVPGTVFALHVPLIPAQGVAIAGLAALYAWWVLVMRRWTASREWSAQHTLALITGMLIPTILLSPVAYAVGQPLPAFALLIVLIVQAVRLQRAARVPVPA